MESNNEQLRYSSSDPRTNDVVDSCISSPLFLLVALEKKFRLGIDQSTYDFLVSSRMSDPRAFRKVVSTTTVRTSDWSPVVSDTMEESMRLVFKFAKENHLLKADFVIEDFLLRVAVIVGCYSLTQSQIKRLTLNDQFLTYIQTDEFNLFDSLPEDASLYNSIDFAVRLCCESIGITFQPTVERCLLVY